MFLLCEPKHKNTWFPLVITKQCLPSDQLISPIMFTCLYPNLETGTTQIKSTCVKSFRNSEPERFKSAYSLHEQSEPLPS